VLDVMGTLLPPPIGTKRLNWHYRSRDERLIAFSNAQPQLYDWSLTTFPGAETGDVITHQLVPFTPGQVDQEQSVAAEVAAVVQAVTGHAHDRPNESLGVITMGIKHMERINEALRRARQEDPDLDDYLNEVFYDTEKFFVKNLERVQGDERDAILISVGYGKNPEGRMLYRFGPLNQKGGERRLNVAITRARARIGVISSFSSADLDPARLKAEGAQMLRDYLLYTESGGADLGERRRERDPLNPFEQDVLSQLSAAGLSLECQVGCSGYWIDFAAKHPSQPGRYVLAIEADGVMYHSSATARDRDRLRQDHLERLGWTFHRIWSTGWFRHREREVARAVAAFDLALNEPHAHVSDPGDQPSADIAAVRRRVRYALCPYCKKSIPKLVEGTEIWFCNICGKTWEGDIVPTDDESRMPIVQPVRTLPKPWHPDGRQITEYPDFELVKFMRWIMSDGVLRTKEELITIGSRELGYERRGARIVAALTKIVDAIQRSEKRP
jgi:very-short-patch-repair endonuclease